MSLETPIEQIVLVDDSEADNVFHEIVLRRSGFDGPIRIFDNPREGLDYLRQLDAASTCLLLLDINMPGMSGWEFAEAATPLLAGKQGTKLLMLTSSSAEDDRERARGVALIQGYLTKPLTRQIAIELLAGRLEPFKA